MYRFLLRFYNCHYILTLGSLCDIKVRVNANFKPYKERNSIAVSDIRIFRTFFTTKPIGQITGLGSSLVYDIVKTLGRELKIEAATTREHKESTFFSHLPSAQQD